MILNIIFIIVGFFLLVKGGDLLVDGSSRIARKFNVKEIIIGLTIVSIGTSMPELIISVTSALKNQSFISFSISAINASSASSAVTFFILLPPLNITQPSLEPAMPISQSLASPGPLTTQPITATFKGLRIPSTRFVIFWASDIESHMHLPHVGQDITSTKSLSSPTARSILRAA